MERRGLAVFCLLAVLLSCISCASGYDPYPGNPLMSAEWKWNYAQSNEEDKLAETGVQITDYDIEYARGRVATAMKDCSDRGGVWCDYAESDRNALQEMLNLKARQSNIAPEVADRGPIPDLTDVIDSAFKELAAIVKGILGWN